MTADHTDISGKVIVITGASSGFGKGAALKFATLGANLILAARRADLIEQIAEQCRQTGAEAIAIATMSLKQKLYALYYKQLSINSAKSMSGLTAPEPLAVGFFTEVPLAEHQQVIETDLLGTIYGSYEALAQFVKQQNGTLINIASMIGKVPAPYYASYTAAKHGVVGLSAALRQELNAQKLQNIHVCTVMPKAMDTPFFEHASNHTGKETVAIPPLDDANKVVDLIVDLISHPKDETAVGMGGGSNLLMHNLLPAMSEALMGKITHKAQIEDAPSAPETSGSVAAPGAIGAGVKDPKLAKK